MKQNTVPFLFLRNLQNLIKAVVSWTPQIWKETCFPEISSILRQRSGGESGVQGKKDASICNDVVSIHIINTKLIQFIYNCGKRRQNAQYPLIASPLIVLGAG